MTQSAKVGSICKFCRHLCDNTQRNQLLVCGMHPYGPAGDDECADFEKLGTGAPPTSRFLPHQCQPETPPTVEVVDGDWEVIENPWTCSPEEVATRSRFRAIVDLLRSLA